MKIELGGYTYARPGWENLDLTTGYDISKELLRRYADESAGECQISCVRPIHGD